VLLAVADGMGGHQAGEVASTLAVKALASHLSQAAGDGPMADGSDWLREAVVLANRTVWDAAAQDSANQGMGTTLVCALVLADGGAAIANVGDSRAYFVSGSVAQLVTEDHSWVLDQVRAGRMTERDAERSPYRHVLSRSLGVLPDVDVDVYTHIQMTPGDALVLCSDGVSNYIELVDLPPLVGSATSATEAAEILVQIALDRGGADNATVVVARAVG
jgi:protein phosphatase